jgi:hypothetical protein
VKRDLFKLAIESLCYGLHRGRQTNGWDMTEEEKEANDRDRLCYEQNCEQMRSLNQIMWQVPMIAVTLTGGLWYAVVTINDASQIAQIALLGFASLANVGLTLMINRVRDVIGLHLAKMKAFHQRGFVDASTVSHSSPFLKDRGVCLTFSALMLIAAAMSFLGGVLIGTGCWIPSP